MLLLTVSFIVFIGMGLIFSYAIWLPDTIGIFERIFYSCLISLVVFPLSVLTTTTLFSHNIIIGILSAFIIALVVSASIIFYRVMPHSDKQK